MRRNEGIRNKRGKEHAISDFANKFLTFSLSSSQVILNTKAFQINFRPILDSTITFFCLVNILLHFSLFLNLFMKLDTYIFLTGMKTYFKEYMALWCLQIPSITCYLSLIDIIFLFYNAQLNLQVQPSFWTRFLDYFFNFFLGLYICTAYFCCCF